MRDPTPMPDWLKHQFDNADKTIESWSDGKCEAAGIPRINDKDIMCEDVRYEDIAPVTFPDKPDEPANGLRQAWKELREIAKKDKPWFDGYKIAGVCADGVVTISFTDSGCRSVFAAEGDANLLDMNVMVTPGAPEDLRHITLNLMDDVKPE